MTRSLQAVEPITNPRYGDSERGEGCSLVRASDPIGLFNSAFAVRGPAARVHGSGREGAVRISRSGCWTRSSEHERRRSSSREKR